jgi:hypothetical protein
MEQANQRSALPWPAVRGSCTSADLYAAASAALVAPRSQSLKMTGLAATAQHLQSSPSQRLLC